MKIDYKIENDIEWDLCETITVKPNGWKEVNIKFVDCRPLLFWRINEIPKNFTSNSDDVSKRGVNIFFKENLEFLKEMITNTIDTMQEDRKKFYQENIITLFDE